MNLTVETFTSKRLVGITYSYAILIFGLENLARVKRAWLYEDLNVSDSQQMGTSSGVACMAGMAEVSASNPTIFCDWISLFSRDSVEYICTEYISIWGKLP